MKPVAVLTGGTSGLGRFIARGLVGSHRLVLVARDAGKADATQRWLASGCANAEIEVEAADLSLLAEVRRAGAAIAARHPAIDVAVLNAGTFQTRRRLTAEGREMVAAVNLLAPFVLTGALEGALRAGRGRLVVVGSSTSDRAWIDPDNLELARGWNLVRAYAQSKLAVMMTAFEWARRLGPEVTVNVVHPGTVATDLIRTTGPIDWAWRLMGAFMMTAEQGAAAPLRAALDPALAGVTGRYLKPGGWASPNRRTLDAALVRRVWDATVALSAEQGGG